MEELDKKYKELALIAIDQSIERLKAIKSNIKHDRLVIGELTWTDFKILYDKIYIDKIDNFLKNK